MVTTEIDRRFMAEICDNGKGNFAAKNKIREQVWYFVVLYPVRDEEKVRSPVEQEK